MIVWIDAQISPYLARWLSAKFNVEARAVRDLGLRDAKDREIFLAAREAGAVVLTKDSDFVHLLEQLGPPPRILWLTVGNRRARRDVEEVRSRSNLPGWGLTGQEQLSSISVLMDR